MLDSLVIEPGSIVSESSFDFDEVTNTISLKSSEDSTQVCYRVLASVITQTHQTRNLDLYEESTPAPSASTLPFIEKEELFDFQGIQKYGAITRGVSFGNRQSVFVNSTLNLQMDGQVADNLYVSAVITDQNIPYQPEGNTQQLRDFDNVYLKLYNDNLSITAGDIVLSNPVEEDYFLRYLKNVQGLQITNQGKMGNWKYETAVAGSSSKGKFASTTVEAIEGLNGPYKLRGPNNERFIIVLANSEKIYLDGILQRRGFDQDYVIDYNLGEVIFNNHIVITQFTRIRIDFEYAEQFYTRSNIAASIRASSDNVTLYSGVFTAKDNPNSNFGFSFNSDDRDVLQSVGDQSDQAFISSNESLVFDSNRILYFQKDTIDLDGNSQLIFVHALNGDQEVFSTSFSDVGLGNGDYVLKETSSNGRVYEWVSRIGEEPQGNYQPGVFVPLPNKQELINIGAEVKLSEYVMIFSEGAFSSLDRNLFSTLDDSDNRGFGYYGGIRSANRPSFLHNYKWNSTLAIEYDAKNFNAIDRYRYIEFDRNWDLNIEAFPPTEDLIVYGKTSLQKDQNNWFNYEINVRDRNDVLTGSQQNLSFNQRVGNLNFQTTNFYLSSNQQSRDSKWLESGTDVKYTKWDIMPGYNFQLSRNELSEADSVISSRMNFHSHEIYLENGDSTDTQFRISYLSRRDRIPINGIMEDYISSQNVKANFIKKGKSNSWKVDFNYRSIDDLLGTAEEQGDIISGRLNWLSNYFKKSLTQNLSFSTGNSRELRREFVYLPVAVGEGTHTWRDQNQDGIQDLNEFFEAINPDERIYVKIFTPTDDYITSFQTFYTHNIDLGTPLKWRQQVGFRKLVSNFSANINLNINYRTTSSNYNDRLNPFSIDKGDANVLARRDLRRYTLFFNRNRRGFSGDVSYRTASNKQLLTQGFELRDKSDWISNIKIDLSADYTFRMSHGLTRNINSSDFLTSRNFEIISNSYRPQMIWQPTTQIRLIGSYEYKNSQNQFAETSNESSSIQRYSGELNWNKIGAGSLRAVFSWVNISFDGELNTYLSYLLLDALQPGSNQTWQVNWQQKMSKGMQLSLIYNGRKSEGSSTINTGNVQVTAYF